MIEGEVRNQEGADRKSSEQAFAIAPPQINLPKGGGAIRGMGEKFDTNLVTGTGTITIPIQTSSGRSGFGPQLSLSYDCRFGNGPFGFGWNLQLPSITRKTDKGIPQYLDELESDVFILSGSEDLVPQLDPNGLRHQTDTPQGYRIQRYVPRVEGLFVRIERWTRLSDGDAHWRTFSRDNILTIYGRDTNSRVADPDDPLRIFTWLISETRDDRGNAILYQYLQESSAGIDTNESHERGRSSNSRTANRYLKRVLYCNKAPLLDPNGKRPDFLDAPMVQNAGWLLEAVFDYGDGHYADLPPDPDGAIFVRARPDSTANAAVRLDPFSSYRSGFELRTYRLCRRVLMFHHFPNELDLPDYLARSTEFHYRETPIASTIVGVTQSGYIHLPEQGGTPAPRYLKKSLPTLEFGYSGIPNTDDMSALPIQEVDADVLESLPGAQARNPYHWIDLDAEGLVGVLTETPNGWYYKRNLSANHRALDRNGEERMAAKFSAFELVSSQPVASLSSGEAQFFDLAGDGQADLVQISRSIAGFYERTTERGWERFRAFQAGAEVSINNENLRFIDLTGDGRADLLITEDDVFTWFESLGEEGYAPARRVQKAIDEEKGPRIVFADGEQAIYLADFSGDGLTDLVRIRKGQICYWPNLGYGNFGKKITMANPPSFDREEMFDQKRIRMADIDGTGVTDILYLGADAVKVYFNQSGNSWSDAVLLPQFPPVDDLSAVQAVDLLGNGTACLAWFSPLPGNQLHPIRYLDLMNGIKPHLLTSMKNNLGAETRIHYAPSTRFYLDDRQAGIDWITPLPFPVHVVERVEVLDHISGNRFVTRHSYHHGYYDGEEREFRGFGLVEKCDTEELGSALPATNFDAASYVPPMLTRTWFHTGVFTGGEKISRQLAHEYFGSPPRDDPQFEAFLKTLLDDTIQPLQSLSPDEMRQACRAMKGSVLRSEIYAGDAKVPITASERSYSIELVQQQGTNRHAVFYTHPRESVTFHYERDPKDPRVQHEVVLKTDRFGSVEQSLKIGYARADVAERLPEQNETHIALTLNRYVNRDDQLEWYRVGLPVESQTFEVVKPPAPRERIFGFPELQTLVNAMLDSQSGNPLQSRLIPIADWDWRRLWTPQAEPGGPAVSKLRLAGRTRTVYRSDDLTAFLPPGQVESLAIAGESYKLAFTPEILSSIYKRPVPNQSEENLLPDAAAILGSKAADGGGYLDLDGDGWWWIPSGRVFYHVDPNSAAQELVEARRHFFLPRKYTNPFEQSTIITFDPYDLLLLSTQDAFGSRMSISERNASDRTVSSKNPYGKTTKSRNDYRVLQPELVTDSNRNRTATAYDALGLVTATAVMGRNDDNPQQGDLLSDFVLSDGVMLCNPGLATVQDFIAKPVANAAALLKRATSRTVYDLDRFRRCGQPALIALLSRDTHVSDAGNANAGNIQVRFQYSDGFAREIQSKIQVEPGDAPFRNPEFAAAGIRDVKPGPLVLQNGAPRLQRMEQRWVGDGRVVYNNKGDRVRKYEPFFSSSHLFEEEAEMTKTGVSIVMFYDPLGRLVAALHPDHTYEKTVFDPWVQRRWDRNDNVLQADPNNDPYVGDYFRRIPEEEYQPTWNELRESGSERIASEVTALHSETPRVSHLDSLGRTVRNVVQNKYSDNGNEISEEYENRIRLDAQGNTRFAVDALGRTVMRADYNVAAMEIRSDSMESGTRWMLYDVTGVAIRSWDSRGYNFRTEYDELRRPARSFVAGIDPENPRREICVMVDLYGEKAVAESIRLNARGRLFLHCDSSGLTINADVNPQTGQLDAFDFKGNPLRSKRWLASDYRNIPDWNVGNWPAAESRLRQSPISLSNLWNAFASLLENTSFSTSTRYDALSRMITVTNPDGSVSRPQYNARNLLQSLRVRVNGENQESLFSTAVSYNAKGQREKVRYENGAITTCEYDPLTLRLRKLETTRPAVQEALASQIFAGQSLVQSLRYVYDPMGNVVEVTDAALNTVIHDNQEVKPRWRYMYDAAYRLIEARGREQVGQTEFDFAPPQGDFRDFPFVGHRANPNDLRAVRNSHETYRYDAAGNIKSVAHNGAWTRSYDYEENSRLDQAQKNNRLTRTRVGNHTETFAYKDAGGEDANGCVTAINNRKLAWNHLEQLQSVDLGGGGKAYYVYDASGQRVRKVLERQNGSVREQRLYLGSVEIYRQHDANNAITLQRQTLLILDEKRCIARVETRTNTAGAPVAPSVIRYQLTNLLGSATVELDANAALISYEEFSPYGASSYQAHRSGAEISLKRYRYAFKERDEETGFYYHGARYYAPWVGRWMSCDPAGVADGLNLYRYARSNPVTLSDPTGMMSKKAQEEFEKNRHSSTHLSGDEIGDIYKSVDDVPKNLQETYKSPDRVLRHQRRQSQGAATRAQRKAEADKQGIVTKEEKWQAAKAGARNWALDRVVQYVATQTPTPGTAQLLGVALSPLKAPVPTEHPTNLREAELKDNYEAMGTTLTVVETGVSIVAPMVAESALANAAPKALPVADVAIGPAQDASSIVQRGDQLFNDLGAKMIKYPTADSPGRLRGMLTVSIVEPAGGGGMRIVTVQNPRAYKLLQSGKVPLMPNEVLGPAPFKIAEGEAWLIPRDTMAAISNEKGLWNVHSEVLGVWNARAMGAEGGLIYTTNPACAGHCGPLFRGLPTWIHLNP